LGRSVVVQGDYRHSWVGYADDEQGLDTPSNQQADANLSVDNYRQGSGLTWALRYNWQQLEYDDDRFFPWKYQLAVAELGFWVSGNTRLFASGGLESAWDEPLDPALEDELWEA